MFLSAVIWLRGKLAIATEVEWKKIKICWPSRMTFTVGKKLSIQNFALEIYWELKCHNTLCTSIIIAVYGTPTRELAKPNLYLTTGKYVITSTKTFLQQYRYFYWKHAIAIRTGNRIFQIRITYLLPARSAAAGTCGINLDIVCWCQNVNWRRASKKRAVALVPI